MASKHQAPFRSTKDCHVALDSLTLGRSIAISLMKCQLEPSIRQQQLLGINNVKYRFPPNFTYKSFEEHNLSVKKFGMYGFCLLIKYSEQIFFVLFHLRWIVLR